MSGRVSGYVISLATSMFLSRLLSPEDFGVLSLAQIFSLMISVIMEMGLSSALIQRKDLRKAEIDSVFTLNLLIVSVLTLALFLAAPFIANFYSNNSLKTGIRIICIQLIFSGLSVVPLALLYRNMNFKQIMGATTVSSMVGSVIAVLMAYRGFGYYSLIFQSVISTSLLFFMLMKLSGFKPAINTKFKEASALFSFSFKIFVSTVLNQIFQKIDILIFGRMYPISTLGYYNRAVSLDNILRSFSSSSILNILLPKFSKIQGNTEAVKDLYVKTLHLLCFLFFIIAGLIFFNAKDIVAILFGPKWAVSGNLLKLILISSFAYPVSSLMLSVIEGSGHAGLFLKLELIKKLMNVPFLFLPFLLSLEQYLMSIVALSYINVIVNAYGLARISEMKAKQSLFVILMYNTIAVVSVVLSSLLFKFLDTGMIWSLLLGTISVLTIYFLLNKLFRTQGLMYFVNDVLSKILRKDLQHKFVS